MGTRKTTNITEDDVWKAARSKRILLKKESPKPQKNIFATDRKARLIHCLLYTSPSPRDRTRSRMPSSA